MKTRSRVFTVGLPILILLAGVIGMVGMVSFKAAPRKVEKPQIGTLVETQPLQAATRCAFTQRVRFKRLRGSISYPR